MTRDRSREPSGTPSNPISGSPVSGSGDLRPDQLRALVEQAQRGDQEAFRVLLDRHRGVATAKAYATLGDVHLSADALQDAFFKTWQKLNTLRQPDRFSGWFLAIVQRAALDVARRRTRVTGHESGWEELPGEHRTPPRRATGPEALLQGERGARIQIALDALPAEYREVIFLKHVEGRSYREMARMLRTTIKAVESRLFRARQQLSKSLEDSDGSAGRSSG